MASAADTVPLGLSPGAGTPSADDWDRMAALGARWVRQDFAWSAIEPADDDLRWTGTDSIVRDATAHGLEVLALLTYAPAWANGGHADNKYPPTAAHAASFEDFTYRTARRYLPRGVTAYELWNEPNHAGFWKPGPDPVAYTDRVLVPGAADIRRAAAESGVQATILTRSG